MAGKGSVVWERSLELLLLLLLLLHQQLLLLLLLLLHQQLLLGIAVHRLNGREQLRRLVGLLFVGADRRGGGDRVGVGGCGSGEEDFPALQFLGCSHITFEELVLKSQEFFVRHGCFLRQNKEDNVIAALNMNVASADCGRLHRGEAIGMTRASCCEGCGARWACSLHIRD